MALALCRRFPRPHKSIFISGVLVACVYSAGGLLLSCCVCHVARWSLDSLQLFSLGCIITYNWLAFHAAARARVGLLEGRVAQLRTRFKPVAVFKMPWGRKEEPKSSNKTIVETLQPVRWVAMYSIVGRLGRGVWQADWRVYLFAASNMRLSVASSVIRDG